MHSYGAFADDYYVNLNLCTEMELPSNRETVLHFFEQVQKMYPVLRNFYARDKNSFVLEEDKDSGNYRWCTVEPQRFCSGQINPQTVEEALEFHRLGLELLPYCLTVSPLDCEALDLLVGFDFSYRGNHNQLITEALGLCPALECLSGLPGARILNNEPSITLALDEDCRLQCRVSIEARTTALQVRTQDFQEEQISVYVTARQYGSLSAGQTYVETLDRLHEICHETIQNYVAEAVLEPLARTIALE